MSIDLDLSFIELLTKIGNLKFHDTMKPRTLHGWTDEMCLIEGQKCCVWKEIPENEMEGHLINFVNLWFGADCKSDDNEIQSTIRNVLLMTPLGTTKDLLLRNVFDSAVESSKTPPAADTEKIVLREPLFDHLNTEDEAKALAFHELLKRHFYQLKMLEMKTSEGQPHCSEYNLVSQKLRAVLGFCALLLMRIMIKSELQVTRCFTYFTSKTFDQLFPEVGLGVLLVAPAPEFFKSASSALSSNCNNKEAVNLLHLLVFQYLKSSTQDDQSSRLTRDILDKGCLKVMEGNGMGLVTLFQDVKLIYSNIEERQLLSMIAVQNGDTESLKLLIKFLDFYAQPGKPQYSWKWARILSQNYFSDMNIKNNQYLCSKLAALLMDENPNIFQLQDLKTGNPWAESGIKWAESAQEKLMKLNDDLGQDVS